MKKNWSKANMRASNNSSHRKEQFRFQSLFKEYAPKLKTEMEYRVFSTDGALLAIIDFADLDNKIAYRLQSVNSYHDSYRQDIRAINQKSRLEKRGWTVEDINEDTREWAFLWEV